MGIPAGRLARYFRFSLAVPAQDRWLARLRPGETDQFFSARSRFCVGWPSGAMPLRFWKA
jgi:hypothetical protein